MTCTFEYLNSHVVSRSQKSARPIRKQEKKHGSLNSRFPCRFLPLFFQRVGCGTPTDVTAVDSPAYEHVTYERLSYLCCEFPSFPWDCLNFVATSTIAAWNDHRWVLVRIDVIRDINRCENPEDSSQMNRKTAKTRTAGGIDFVNKALGILNSKLVYFCIPEAL